MLEIDARCPECGDEPAEIHQLTEVYAQERVQVVLQRFSTGDPEPVEASEPESEVLDADRDGQEFECQSCGYSTQDPTEFEPDDAPEDDEL